MISVDYVLGSDAFAACADGDGHSVFVGAADEFDVFASESEVSYIYVRRNVDAGKVTEVHGAVGVGQGGCDHRSLEILFHCIYSFF